MGSYVVQAGDTLWDICKRFFGNGQKYTWLARINGISNPDLIYPGQVLTW
jgi:nucleoid-associated protein YgaU